MWWSCTTLLPAGPEWPGDQRTDDGAECIAELVRQKLIAGRIRADSCCQQSFKKNQIAGNGTDGTPITAVPGGPLN